MSTDYKPQSAVAKWIDKRLPLITLFNIPISKSSRSLNVSTAAAIALSEAMRQLKI